MKKFFTLCCVCLTLAAGVRAQDGARRPAEPPSAKLSGEPMPLNHGGKIEAAYDGFARETVVSLKRMSVTCGTAKDPKGLFKGVCVSLQAALHCPGKQLDHVRGATLRFTFESKNWDARHSPNERQLSAVADGETLRLGKMTLLSNAVGEGWDDEDAKETLEIHVPYHTFLKLAHAAYVEFSVGRTAFALRDKNIAALRDMNNRVKLPDASPGAPAQSGGN